MKEEEKILIEKAKHGDEKAFKQLYDNYYRLIRYIIYDAIKDEEATADLLSVTFTKAFKRLDYFVETMQHEKSPGKKLGFIAQEIGREVNTLGSKSNHSEMQKIVVLMKDDLEQIKEQVLNVL